MTRRLVEPVEKELVGTFYLAPLNTWEEIDAPACNFTRHGRLWVYTKLPDPVYLSIRFDEKYRRTVGSGWTMVDNITSYKKVEVFSGVGDRDFSIYREV